MVDIAKLENKRASEDSPSSDRPTKKGAISEDVEAAEADADAEDMEENAAPLDDPCLDLLKSETSPKSKEDVDRSAEFLKKEEYADALLESTKVLTRHVRRRHGPGVLAKATAVCTTLLNTMDNSLSA